MTQKLIAGTSQVLFMKGKLSIAILALSISGASHANDLNFAEKVSSLIDGSSEPVVKNIKDDLSDRQSLRLSPSDIKTIENQSTKFDTIKFEIKMKEQLLKKRQIEEKIKSLSENPLKSTVDDLTQQLENRNMKFEKELQSEIKRVSNEYETSIAQYKSEIENLKDEIIQLKERKPDVSSDEKKETYELEIQKIEEEIKSKIFPIKVKGFSGDLTATIFYQNNIYTKKVGDFIENKFRVEHITPTSVTFTDKDKVITNPVVTKDEAYVRTYKGKLRKIELTLQQNSESDEENGEPMEMATEIMPDSFGGFPNPMNPSYM